MSTFERYVGPATHYDQTWVPIGAEIMRDTRRDADGPVSEMTLPDAGGGTDAYAVKIS